MSRGGVLVEPLRVALASSRSEGLIALYEACTRAGHLPAAAIAPRPTAPKGPVDVKSATEFSAFVHAVPDGLDLILVAGNNGLDMALSGYHADIMICHGFPWRLSETVLRTPRLGVLNIHTSLLPRHRGPMPVHWALLHGDTETGVTIHWMDHDFDAGPIVAQQAGVLLPDTIDDEIADGLIRTFDDITRDLVPIALERATQGCPGEPQNHADATYEGPIGPEWSTVDWSRTAHEIHNQVRARRFGIYDPPGPTAELDGHRISLLQTSLQPADGLQAQCSDAPLWITQYLHLPDSTEG
ncbi:methionyl-tRNA formyltransferase [Nocardia jiangxiensis]|uniref:Methionyl-tRNA formyltransferase n=1 Tax=Nocardia jiangxiensis TaxID=282685 RepID=A0ABW6SF60_9NOCA|nr:formyltransferase family protein [Nocardia jiangxiensis]